MKEKLQRQMNELARHVATPIKRSLDVVRCAGVVCGLAAVVSWTAANADSGVASAPLNQSVITPMGTLKSLDGTLVLGDRGIDGQQAGRSTARILTSYSYPTRTQVLVEYSKLAGCDTLYRWVVVTMTRISQSPAFGTCEGTISLAEVGSSIKVEMRGKVGGQISSATYLFDGIVLETNEISATLIPKTPTYSSLQKLTVVGLDTPSPPQTVSLEDLKRQSGWGESSKILNSNGGLPPMRISEPYKSPSGNIYKLKFSPGLAAKLLVTSKTGKDVEHILDGPLNISGTMDVRAHSDLGIKIMSVVFQNGSDFLLLHVPIKSAACGMSNYAIVGLNLTKGIVAATSMIGFCSEATQFYVDTVDIDEDGSRVQVEKVVVGYKQGKSSTYLFDMGWTAKRGALSPR